MKTLLSTLVALSLVGVVYAEDNTNKAVPTTNSDTTAPGVSSADKSAEDQPDAPKDKDNTAQNQRDKSGETLTPEDQSNTPEDIQLTAAIRRSLVKDDALSMNAKNIKVITIQGAVTLRGTVNSEDEKNKIAATAKGVQGIKELKNELEVKKD
ncbi:MAG: BON domain-containing protein [Chthoniobacterales bacterium]